MCVCMRVCVCVCVHVRVYMYIKAHRHVIPRNHLVIQFRYTNIQQCFVNTDSGLRIITHMI